MIKGCVKPKQRRYKKHCAKCGKDFRCDGECGRDEELKDGYTWCYCGECFLKYISQTPYEFEKCSTRFGKKREQKEKVIFT